MVRRMREFGRSERVADALQRELSILIRDELRDPRVRMANINVVEVSSDLSSAKVYVTFIGADDTASQQGVEALNGAVGFLRTRLSKLLEMRITPRLRFYYDSSGKRGQRLSALIDYAVSEDKRRSDKED